MLEFINEVLSRYNFNLNKKKTRFYSPKHRGKITGLIITDDSKISVGTEQRNRIKKMVYNKLVNKKGDPDQVLGYLAYLKDIEPITYNNLIIKYSKYCTGDVIAELRK